MEILLVQIGFILVFFFLLVPAGGAFYVRHQWRRFRGNMVESSLRPFVSYRDVHEGQTGFLGAFRFIGSLDALEENSIWIRSSRLTVNAKMDKCQVFVLPSQEDAESEGLFESNAEILPEENPQKVAWRNIFSLPEGTKVFITGGLYRENGKAIFRADRECPLVMVIYDGPEQTILRRSIWGGRHKNEYWNQFTFPSLIIGFFSLLVFAYLQFRGGPETRLPGIIALTAALAPVAGFLPPGLLGAFLFRSNWRKARTLRAERDLLLLPVRYFPEGEEDSGKEYEPALLIDGNPYGIRIQITDLQSIGKTSTSELRVRVPSTISRPGLYEKKLYYQFGLPLPAGDELYYIPPADPMAEYLVTPGNPRALSDRCSDAARRFEYISVVSIGLGLSINLLIIFTILNLVIR